MMKERRNVSRARLGNNIQWAATGETLKNARPRGEQWLSVPILAGPLLRSNNGMFSTCVLFGSRINPLGLCIFWYPPQSPGCTGHLQGICSLEAKGITVRDVFGECGSVGLEGSRR